VGIAYVLVLETSKGNKLLERGNLSKIQKAYNEWKGKIIRFPFLEVKENDRCILINRDLIDDLVMCSELEYSEKEIDRLQSRRKFYENAEEQDRIIKSELLDNGYKP